MKKTILYTVVTVLLLSASSFIDFAYSYVSATPIQCRKLNQGQVDWPIRNPQKNNQSAIDCKKMFQRLSGQTLYLHETRNEYLSPLLKSNFFKYPEPVDCLDANDKFIDCLHLDIEQVSFKKINDNKLLATILHPDLETNTAFVELINNDKICQIRINPKENGHTFKAEIYNILALYDGRQNPNNTPQCNEEAIALAPTFQDQETKNWCKKKIEIAYKEALKRTDQRDHEELKKRANQLKKDCDTADLNQFSVNFILDPNVNATW